MPDVSETTTTKRKSKRDGLFIRLPKHIVKALRSEARRKKMTQGGMVIHCFCKYGQEAEPGMTFQVTLVDTDKLAKT
jgi:hypothetical protein